jgi:hypothetical protein
VKCLRIFADGNGDTHMEDIGITLQPKKLFKDTPPLGLTENLPASWYNIVDAIHNGSGRHREVEHGQVGEAIAIKEAVVVAAAVEIVPNDQARVVDAHCNAIVIDPERIGNGRKRKGLHVLPPARSANYAVGEC